MDSAREHVWGQLLLERAVLQQGHLQQLVSERNLRIQQGQDCTIAQLLVQKRWVDATRYGVLNTEVDGRGRVCAACQTPFLTNGTQQCPRCGSGQAHALSPSGSGRFPAPGSGSYAPVQGQAPGSGSYSPGSGGFRPPPSGGFNVQQPGSGGFPAATNPAYGGGSGSYGYAGGQGSGSYAAAPGFAGSGSHYSPQAPSGAYNMGAGSGAYNMGAGSGAYNMGAGSGAYNMGAYSGAAFSTGMGTGQYSGPQSGAYPQVGSTHSGFGIDSESSDSGDLGVGKRIGRYEVIDELGRGGMGVVYKARIVDQPHAIVAVKVLLAGEFASERLKERFKAEAQICQKLQHKNIVSVHDVGEVDGLLYYSMDYVQGQELQDMIRSKSLPIRRGVEILVEVAHAAHHAHENGVVHRDLKPSNILVGQDGMAYIMDFGLAKNLESDKGLTKSGVAIGTPYYMPPEQARGNHREMDARSDVYALGAILYEIVTRRVPFTAKTQNDLLRKIIEEEAQPPRQVRAGVPNELEIICLKALAKDKDERFTSARAMAEDLERFLSGEPILAKAPAFWKPWVRKLRRNKSQAAIVVAAGMAVVLALLIVFKLHSEYQTQVAHTNAELDKERTAAEADKLAKDKEIADQQRAQKTKDALRTKLTRDLSTGQEAWSDARRATSPNAARTAYRRALEAYEAAAEGERGLEGEQASTRYRVAQIRRALCRWRQAQEDFSAAAKLSNGTHLARSKLAAAQIKLRIGADRRGSLDVLDSLIKAFKPGALSELEPEEQREEKVAAGIAKAYVDYLRRGYDDGRKLLQDLLSGTLPRGLAGDVHGALAYLEVMEGAALGGDEHAARGLRPSQQARGSDRFRYEFLVDRAIILARNPKSGANALREAMGAARDARRLDIDGEWAQLAEATLLAAQRAFSKMTAALDSAETKARNRSALAVEAVRAYADRLRVAVKKVAKTQAKTKLPVQARDFELPKIKFNGGGFQSTLPVLINVQPNTAALLFTAGDGGRLGQHVDLLLFPGRVPPIRSNQELQRIVQSAPWSATSTALTEVLFVAKSARLKPGLYTLLVVQPPNSRSPVQVTVRGKFLRKGQPQPFVYQTLPTIQVPQAAIPEAKRAIALFESGKVKAGLEAWKQVEAKDPNNLVLVAKRVEMLSSAKRLKEASALADSLRKRTKGKPIKPLLALLLASSDLAAKNQARAIKVLSPLVKQFPVHAEFSALLATAFRNGSDHRKGLQICEAALKRGFKMSIVLEAARCEAGLGKSDEAAKRLLAAIRHPFSSLQNINDALNTLVEVKAYAQVHVALADIQRRAGGNLITVFNLQRAQALSGQGKHDQAIALLRQLQPKLPPFFKAKASAILKDVLAAKAGKRSSK